MMLWPLLRLWVNALLALVGSVVLKDVRPWTIVLGNPAREIAENKDERVFD